MGGLKADSGGAPASTAPFSELASEPEAMSWARMDATKVLSGEGVDGVVVWFATVNVAEVVVVVVRCRMGQEGGQVQPTQGNAQHGGCAVCASSAKGGGW